MTNLTFEAERPRLWAIAYRMLGSAAEAEDVVQDAYLRWHRARDSDNAPRDPGAWLATVVTRLCIDQLKSARSRREHYVGPWLPEPLLTDRSNAPEAAATLADSLSTAFLLLLEQLGPTERAVFLLREVFDYAYEEIAPIVDKSEANCRQIASRARRSLGRGSTRFTADADMHRALLERFLAAAREGDVEGFATLLAEDVAFWPDGGGKDPGRGGVRAIRRPILGRGAVAKLVASVMQRRAGSSARVLPINGRAGAVVYIDDELHAVITLDVTDGHIGALYLVTNPDKLEGLAQQLGRA